MSKRDRVRKLVKAGKNDRQIADIEAMDIQTVYKLVSDLYSEAGIDGRHRGAWRLKQGDIVGRRGALRHYLNGDLDD